MVTEQLLEGIKYELRMIRGELRRIRELKEEEKPLTGEKLREAVVKKTKRIKKSI